MAVMPWPPEPVVLPRALAAILPASNGRLPAALLRTIPGSKAGKPAVTMWVVASWAFQAMRAAAASDGITLDVTSAADSYRTYDQQARLFRDRHTTSPTAAERRAGATSVWKGVTWWLRIGADGQLMAQAAVPGTSYHGKGLAGDVALDSAGRVFGWLVANAHRFGFSWEIQSEKWHIRYYRGDDTPDVVLAYMRENDMAWDDMIKLAQVPGVEYNDSHGNPVTELPASAVLASDYAYGLQFRNTTRAALAELAGKVDRLAGGGVDPAVLKAAVDTAVAAAVAKAMAEVIAAINNVPRLTREEIGRD